MTRTTRILVLVLKFIFFLLLSLPVSVLSADSPASPPSIRQGTDHPDSRSVKQDDPHIQEIHCSRERSRAAWNVIEEYLMPFVEQEKYQISPHCRLHPSNDLFRDQEEHKVHVDVNEWRCGYCKKSFRAEKYLDQHFDNRHYNLLNVNNGKCLADVCGALHCDLMMTSAPRKKKCNPAAASKNRHLCESLADSCFPVKQGPSAARLHELFLRQFCDAHSCSGGKKPFAKGGKMYYVKPARLINSFVTCKPVKEVLVKMKQFQCAVGMQKSSSILYMAAAILILLLLPIFYILIYLNQRQMHQGTQQLKRIPKLGRKTKPS